MFQTPSRPLLCPGTTECKILEVWSINTRYKTNVAKLMCHIMQANEMEYPVQERNSIFEYSLELQACLENTTLKWKALKKLVDCK